MHLALALLLLLAPVVQAGPTPPAADSPAADTTRIETGFTFSPGALYSSTAGFGIGVGYRIRNLVRRGTRVHVWAEPAQHRGRYGASVTTADPRTARAHALLSLFYETTGRQWFYGLGPASGGDVRIGVGLETIQVEARTGVRRGPLLLQPSLRLLRHDVDDLFRAGRVNRLDPRSQAHLAYLVDAAPRQAGLIPALDAVLELGTPERDGLLLQATARRYLGLGSSGDGHGARRFTTYTVGAFGFIPLPRDHTLALRAIAQTTSGETGATVPFYLLPELGGRLLPGIPRYRFFGDDLVVLAAEYRLPILRLLQVARVDLALSAGVGGIYDDVGDQFSLEVSFDDDLEAGRARYPLRPAAGIALRLATPDGRRNRLTAVFGVSPGRWSIVTFRFVPRLTAERPLVR